MSGSRTITKDEDLNVHPGEILRLARYFNMSDGFFLHLQVLYDLCTARRLHADAIAAIEPRAA
ncbi:MAG: hypothetical protein E6R12_09310 [Sphingomonadales bacterium]|nr:MAG: hypothetical protein E6R12_09310 [Sphingomonadales bacterium]